MFKIEIAASTKTELHRAIEAATGARLIQNATDEELLEAMRQRCRPRGLVVNVERFSTVADSDEAA